MGTKCPPRGKHGWHIPTMKSMRPFKWYYVFMDVSWKMCYRVHKTLFMLIKTNNAMFGLGRLTQSNYKTLSRKLWQLQNSDGTWMPGWGSTSRATLPKQLREARGKHRLGQQTHRMKLHSLPGFLLLSTYQSHATISSLHAIPNDSSKTYSLASFYVNLI